MATISFVVLGYKAKITYTPKKCINEINVKRYVTLYIYNYPLGIFIYLVMLIRLGYSFHIVVFFYMISTAYT